MNTPAHAMLGLLVLGRRQPGHQKSAAIVFGGVLPDLVLIGFYAWHLLLGTPESQIWSVEYYRPEWQGWFDVFNSIPLVLIAMLIAWRYQKSLWLVFLASLLLHALTDLPLHNDDAHRHFFPFSDWRFESPVSYWDPAHHGEWASLAELICMLAAACFLYLKHPPLRAWTVGILSVYLAYLGYAFLVWM